MGVRLGDDHKLYYDATGWQEVTIVEEATLNDQRSEGEVENRGSDFTRVLVGKRGVSLDVTVTHDPADTAFVALRDAQRNGTTLKFAVADGAIATSGTQYVEMECYVTKNNRAEPLKERASNQFTLRPAADATDPVNPTAATVA